MSSPDHRAPQKRFILLGDSEAMRLLRADLESAARSDAKVLLTGETGVGKDVVAHAIHQRSRRQSAPFITINCAGVPDSLLESAFFGHARGSFTGAFRDSPGLLRQAHGGTVFLDEVGEMSLRMQALLLRFLETGEIQTVGASTSHARIDVRVITATNRNLLESAASHEFREDLYYRLNVFHLTVPPLRERPSDIPQLLDYYGRLFAEQHTRPAPVPSAATLDRLMAYPWPGNIRELKNVVERLVLRVNAPTIEPAHLPANIMAHAANPSVQTPRHQAISISHKGRLDDIMERLRLGESFWTAVYPLFMARDITRDDIRFVVRAGLEETHGSYRLLVGRFNMAADDYKRFLGFLKQHDCHLPFQRFRTASAALRDSREERATRGVSA